MKYFESLAKCDNQFDKWKYTQYNLLKKDLKKTQTKINIKVRNRLIRNTPCPKKPEQFCWPVDTSLTNRL